MVAVDDLFVSPVELPKDYLAAVLTRAIASAEFNCVGGILLLNPISYGAVVEYHKYFVPNVGAQHPLPDNVRAGFIAGNSDPQGPRWLRE